MQDIETAYQEYKRAKIKYNKVRFLQALLDLGAERIAEGIYRLGDWDCYLLSAHCKNTRNGQKLRMKKFLGMDK